MADTTKYYLSSDIVAYPCSNATDDGKLNIEENMSAIVTRITNRNYALTKGSFKLSIVAQDGSNVINITPGSANIQGYHVITTKDLQLPPPKNPGTNLAICFKLARDSSGHVLGDVTYANVSEFNGLWVSYFPLEDAKKDPDILILGTVDWDGSNFSNLKQNPDIYARIDGETIILNIDDPKHPEYTTISLQELMDNLKDWYVSKDGDDEYGTILFKTDRGLPSTNYGISIAAKDQDNSEILVRPSSSTDASLQAILGSNKTNPYLKLASTLFSTTDNNLLIDSIQDINMLADRNTNITSHNQTVINTDQDNTMESVVNKNNVIFRKDLNSKTHLFDIDEAGLYYSLGSMKISYINSNNSATINGVSKLTIDPDTTFSNNVTVSKRLDIGTNSKTYITNTQFVLEDGIKSTIDKNGIKLDQNGSAINPSISVYNTNSSLKTDITPSLIKLTGNSAGIEFINSTLGTVTLKRSNSANTLNLGGNLEATGDISAKRVFNAVYNDLAEAFPLSDPEEVIEVGELVEVDPATNKYRKCQERYSKYVVGVCSDSYGQLLGGNPEKPGDLTGFVPVGLAGRVKVKVTGLVCLGDLLTSSHIPGVAMAVEYDRAHPGTVIGKCVEMTEKEDEVIMLISIG